MNIKVLSLSFKIFKFLSYIHIFMFCLQLKGVKRLLDWVKGKGGKIPGLGVKSF